MGRRDMGMRVLPQGRRNLLISLLVSSLTVALSASAQAKPRIHRLYDGPQKPAAEIAILHTTEAAPSFGLLTVDGKKPADGKYYGSGWDNKFLIEMLPGTHAFEIAVRRMAGHWSLTGVISFSAEAGHEYEIDAREITRMLSPTSTEFTGEWQAWA
jgi:hypothetical protein